MPVERPAPGGRPLSAEQAGAWRRLHPITILREVAAAAWRVVVPVVLLGALDGGPVDRLELLVPLLLGSVALMRYLSTRYLITPEAVRWRRGLVFRQRLEIPRSRIQNVAVGTDVLGRVFGARTVTISTAGSEGEIELALVSGSEASFLLQDLLGVHDPVAAGTPLDELLPPGAPAVPPPTRRLVSLPIRGLLLFALTRSSAVVVLLVVAAALVVAASGGGPRPLVLVLLAMATPVLSSLELLDFELTSEPDRVRVRSGLLRIRDRWARRERIQVLHVSRPLLRGALGYETISVATADPTIRHDADVGLCSPLARRGTWPQLASELLEETRLQEADLRPVSELAVRRRTIRFAGLGAVPAALAAGVVGAATGWPEAAATLVTLGVAVGVLASRLGRRAQRQDGFGLDDTHLLVRRGVLGSQLWLVRRAKVQSVLVQATPFQRRLGLASLLVDTASVTDGGVVVPDLPSAVAEALAAELVEHADRVFLPDGV